MAPRRSSRRKSVRNSYVVPGEKDIPDASDLKESTKKNKSVAVKKKTAAVKDEEKENLKLKPSNRKRERPHDNGSEDEAKNKKDADFDVAVDAAMTSSDEESKASPSNRKKSRPSSKNAVKVSTKQIYCKKYGTVKERTCPFCAKVFSIVTGLAYHIENRVCQKPQKHATASAIGSIPFPVLEPGDTFVTKWGIAKVIKDARIPKDFGKTKISKDIKSAKRSYSRKKDRQHQKRHKLRMFVAKVSRKRRQTLIGLHQQLIGLKINAMVHAEKNFQIYCPSSTPLEILTDGTTKQRVFTQKGLDPMEDLGPDPAIPLDSYPERIVECILIRDERKKYFDMDEEINGRWSQVGNAFAMVEKVQREVSQMKKREKSNGSALPVAEKTQEPCQPTGNSIFITRDSLVHRYNAQSPLFVCNTCWKEFHSRVGCKSHIEENTCTKRKAQFEQDRSTYLQEIEDSLKTEVKTPPSLMPPPPRLPPGQKKKKNAHKLPGWIVYHPMKSVIYPEVFTCLKFRRGSNNTKFMQKKFDELGPGRKKKRKSRSRKAVVVKTEAKTEAIPNRYGTYSELPIYYSVQDILFPSSMLIPGRSPSCRAASEKAKKKVALYIGEIGDGYDDNDNDNNGEDEYNPEFETNGIDDDIFPPEVNLDAPMPPLSMSILPPESDNFPVTTTEASLQLPLPREGATTQLSEKATTSKCVTTSQLADTANANVSVASKSDDQSQPPLKKRRRKRKSDTPQVLKAAAPIIIDIRPLAEEVRAGRYPSMKVYTGEHLNICYLCKTEGDDVFHCEFCVNSEHLDW